MDTGFSNSSCWRPSEATSAPDSSIRKGVSAALTSTASAAIAKCTRTVISELSSTAVETVSPAKLGARTCIRYSPGVSAENHAVPLDEVLCAEITRFPRYNSTRALGTTAESGSMTFTFRSAAKELATNRKSERTTRSVRTAILLCTRKGLSLAIRAGLLAQRARVHTCLDPVDRRLPTAEAAVANCLSSLTVARQRGVHTRFPARVASRG